MFTTSLLGWVAVDKDVEGKDVDELAANTTWPSKKLFRASIQKMLKSIWDDYLSGKVSLQSKIVPTLMTQIKYPFSSFYVIFILNR